MWVPLKLQCVGLSALLTSASTGTCSCRVSTLPRRAQLTANGRREVIQAVPVQEHLALVKLCY